MPEPLTCLSLSLSLSLSSKSGRLPRKGSGKCNLQFSDKALFSQRLPCITLCNLYWSTHWLDYKTQKNLTHWNLAMPSLSKCLTDSTLVKKVGTRRGSLDSKWQKSLHIGEAAAMSHYPKASLHRWFMLTALCLLMTVQWGASDQPRLIAMSAIHVYGLLFGTSLCHIKGMTPHTRTLLVSLAVCVDCHVGTRGTTNSHLHRNAHFGGPRLHSTAARCIACHIEVSWQPANCLLLPRHVAPQDLLNSPAKKIQASHRVPDSCYAASDSTRPLPGYSMSRGNCLKTTVTCLSLSLSSKPRRFSSDKCRFSQHMPCVTANNLYCALPPRSLTRLKSRKCMTHGNWAIYQASTGWTNHVPHWLDLSQESAGSMGLRHANLPYTGNPNHVPHWLDFSQESGHKAWEPLSHYSL